MHLTRYTMYKKFGEFFKKKIHGKILGISGISNFYPFIDMENTECIEMDYPAVDMRNLPFADNTFDYVISDQVIEHIDNPQKSIDESRRVLKPGGIAIHTTCFINPVHYGPNDYWRFSLDGLRYLCRDFSEIIWCAGWGNHIAASLIMLHDNFRTLRIPDTKFSIRHWLATKNEKKYPIVTWILAKK